MRISDWSSDVCSSDLFAHGDWSCRGIWAMGGGAARGGRFSPALRDVRRLPSPPARGPSERSVCRRRGSRRSGRRSEEHTSELQSLMRISYAVFCLKKKKQKTTKVNTHDSIAQK